MWLLNDLARSYERLTSRVRNSRSCAICLDTLPTQRLRNTRRSRRQSAAQSAVRDSVSLTGDSGDAMQEHEKEAEPTFAKLSCKHRFCTACIKQYIDMKIQAKEVDDDQLVCPELQCKRWVAEHDILLVCGGAALRRFQTTLQRKRDERNPSARWCPRPGCDELIVCDSTADFTCPSCKTVGCFRCRGYAHGETARCTAPINPEDASYLEWEKSVGGGVNGDVQPVRPCPQCKLRIWKADGCNHITCAGCRFEFCWVCASTWAPSHYSCSASASQGHWLQSCLNALAFFGAVWLSMRPDYSTLQLIGILCMAMMSLEVSVQRTEDARAERGEQQLVAPAWQRMAVDAIKFALVLLTLWHTLTTSAAVIKLLWEALRQIAVLAVVATAAGWSTTLAQRVRGDRDTAS